MYFATDRRTHKIVTAESANRWRDYSCPTCNAGVFLRDGRYRDKHFAHMPGQAKPECEEFHPSNELVHSSQTNTAIAVLPSVDPLQLSIELEPDRVSGRGRRNWRLCLTVPKSHDGRGKVSIDLGGGDVRLISLAKLSLGAETYTVDLTASEYGARWVSPEVHPDYKSAVEERAAGLSSGAINVFSPSRQKQKPSAKALCWGESFYFIWRVDEKIAFPPGLISHQLADNRGWSCALAVLPHTPDEKLGLWLTDNCSLAIIRAKREWALVYPPAYAVDDNNSLEVPPATEVILALKSIGNQAAGELTCTVGQAAPVSLELANVTQHIAELSEPKGTTNKVTHFAWDGVHVVTLVGKAYSEAAIEPTVSLEFELDGSKVSAALHQGDARLMFSGIRDGKSRLTAVHIHPALHGELQYRDRLGWRWNSEPLIALPTGVAGLRKASLPANLIERITTLLQDRSLDVMLDFGAFGKIHVPGLNDAPTSIATFQVPRELRTRIEWLSKASGVFVTRQRMPIGALDDDTLMRHFAQLAVPAELVGHKRALETALRDSSNQGTSS
jgi:hypothetical protein